MFASHRNANRAIRNSPHTEMKEQKNCEDCPQELYLNKQKWRMAELRHEDCSDYCVFSMENASKPLYLLHFFKQIGQGDFLTSKIGVLAPCFFGKFMGTFRRIVRKKRTEAHRIYQRFSVLYCLFFSSRIVLTTASTSCSFCSVGQLIFSMYCATYSA